MTTAHNRDSRRPVCGALVGILAVTLTALAHAQGGPGAGALRLRPEQSQLPRHHNLERLLLPDCCWLRDMGVCKDSEYSVDLPAMAALGARRHATVHALNHGDCNHASRLPSLFASQTSIISLPPLFWW